MEWTQPKWSTQLRHVLVCYNVTMEEEDEDPRNINIREEEVHREFDGPKVENLDISVLLKTI